MIHKSLICMSMAFVLVPIAHVQEREDTTPDAGFIEVYAVGRAEREPSHFVVNATLQIRREQREKASRELEAFTKKVGDEVAEIRGLTSLQIETEQLYTNAERSKKCERGGPLFGTKDGECEPISYNAYVQYRIEGSPADKAGDVVSFLEQVEDSENRISGFFYEQTEKANQAARADAIRRAVANARTLANGANVRLGEIVSIKEGTTAHRSLQRLSGVTSSDYASDNFERRSRQPRFEISTNPKLQEFHVGVTLRIEIEQ